MSDQATSLPIRTESAGDVDIFLSDSVTPSQKLKIEADGSINANTTISATDLDIRDLVFATDKVDASGSEVSLDAATLAALESVTVSATDLDIRDLAFATDTVDASGSEVSLDAATLAALENVVVSATDLDIRDLDAASDSVAAHLKDATGAAFSVANPLPVVVSNNIPGTGILDYNTAAAVAKDATSSHTYTVTAAKTFRGLKFWASASGKMKVEVQIAGVSKFVGFNSTANPNIEIDLKSEIEVAAAATVVIIRTNLDNGAQDLYSTIQGVED